MYHIHPNLSQLPCDWSAEFSCDPKSPRNSAAAAAASQKELRAACDSHRLLRTKCQTPNTNLFSQLPYGQSADWKLSSQLPLSISRIQLRPKSPGNSTPAAAANPKIWRVFCDHSDCFAPNLPKYLDPQSSWRACCERFPHQTPPLLETPKPVVTPPVNWIEFELNAAVSLTPRNYCDTSRHEVRQNICNDFLFLCLSQLSRHSLLENSETFFEPLLKGVPLLLYADPTSVHRCITSRSWAPHPLKF